MKNQAHYLNNSVNLTLYLILHFSVTGASSLPVTKVGIVCFIRASSFPLHPKLPDPFKDTL